MRDSVYQLIFLGDTACAACERIRSRFSEMFAERGLDASLIAFLDGTGVMRSVEDGGYDSAKPSFAFYFGAEDHQDKDIAAVEKLKGNADAIFPIFFTDGRFKEEIPKLLHPINGRLYDEHNPELIVNVAFEELRLLRKTRRVFISYKRSDTVGVANQLYDALSRCQFDVFLDTYSIRGSLDVQHELMHKLTDSDVLIQLNSAHFMDSDWCKDEISEANARQVGVLQLNWPGVDPGDRNQLCQSRVLSSFDFRWGRYGKASSELKTNVLGNVAREVECLRARNLAARQDGLTAEFVKAAAREGRTIIKEPAFLVEERSGGKVWYYIPAIGVPQSVTFQESRELLDWWDIKDPEKVFIIYDDLSVLPEWVAHLDWMSRYFEVKTIKKQEFEEWLRKTK